MVDDPMIPRLQPSARDQTGAGGCKIYILDEKERIFTSSAGIDITKA
jgi:hypothetical protein